MNKFVVAFLAASFSFAGQALAQMTCDNGGCPTPTARPTGTPTTPAATSLRIDCRYEVLVRQQDYLTSLPYAKSCAFALTFGNPNNQSDPKIEVADKCIVAANATTCSINVTAASYRLPNTYTLVGARSLYVPDIRGQEIAGGCLPATFSGLGTDNAKLHPVAELMRTMNGQLVGASIWHRLLCKSKPLP